MTLRQRRRNLLISYGIMIIILSASIACAIIAHANINFNKNYYSAFTQILCLAVFLIISGGILILSFKKTMGPEIFFFCLYLFSLSFEGLRSFQIYLYINGAPILSQTLISRIIYGGRAFAVFNLFAASLFCTGFEPRKMSGLLAIFFILAGLFGLNMLVLTNSINKYYIFPLGYAKEIYVTYLAVIAFCLIDYIFGFIKSSSTEFLILALSSLVSAAGGILIYFPPNNLLYICGLFLLCFGSIFYSSRIHSLYLWS